MASKKILRGVVGNFLGTYVSRYTDYEGYWLFGFIVADLDELQIDLLAPITKSIATAHDAAVQIAVSRFEDQVQKVGLVLTEINEASLTIQRLSGSFSCCVNGRPQLGYKVKFSARATIDNDRTYSHEMTITVAPHNADIEGRSGRYNPLND